jgi:Tfp pilus assembly protein PilZ
MTSDPKRRDHRYAIRFPAKLAYGKKELSLSTEDVSFRGIFVRTDTPPKLRQLVRIQLVLPHGERALKVHGMVVHVADGEARPGVGIQFYAMDYEARDTWDALIRYVETNCPPASEQTPLVLPENTPQPVRARFARHTAVIQVKLPKLSDLEGLYASELSEGGMFVPTGLELSPGADVVLQVTHPETGEVFLFDAVVRHRHARLPAPGYFVEFSGVDASRRADFLDFVRSGIHIAEELVVSVA